MPSSRNVKTPPLPPPDDTDELDDLFAGNTQNEDMQREIVHELLSSEDIEKKTELAKPIAWSALRTIKHFLKSHALTGSAGIITGFMRTSFKYLLSHDRKSRAEFVEALKSVHETDVGAEDEGGVDLAHPR